MFSFKGKSQNWLDYLWLHFTVSGWILEGRHLFKDNNSNRIFMILQFKDGYINASEIKSSEINTKEQAIEKYINICQKQIDECNGYIDKAKAL